jgi:hypothetical protein
MCVALLAQLLFARTGWAAPDANLIGNGDFESGVLTGWSTCGGVGLADANAGAGASEVHAGRYALRIGTPSDGSCGDTLTPQLQAAYANISVPNDATNVTLSFWYSRAGDFGASSAFWALNVALVSSDGGETVQIVDYIYPDVEMGWNLARWELSPADALKARGRTFRLDFYVQFSLSAGNQLAYYIDDIEVLPNIARTPLESAPPAALADDNTQPLIGLGPINGANKIIRADFNGSDAREVLGPQLGGSVNDSRWLPNGQTASVIEDTLKPEPGEMPSVNWVQISALMTANADGSNAREVYRTPGKKLVPGSPAGCRLPRTDCIRYDDPASDNVLFGHSWSPDGARVAVHQCGWLRYADGTQAGETCKINIVNAATGAIDATIAQADNATWSSANRLLYRVNLNPSGISKGIYELDMTSLSPVMTGTLIFPLKSQVDPSEAMALRWSPDGRYFASMRYVRGNHYDSAGTARFNMAVMLFDRQNPTAPRQLVLMDFGKYMSHPTWSPDGKYLLYTLQRYDNGLQTYWLEVATGKTGLLTGALAYADWRPDAALNPNLQPRNYLPMVRR